MKLSIWQQFSSNHSANYTVVAKFKTPEDAERIAETLTDIVKQIRDTTPIRDADVNNEANVPTALEKSIGKQYGFDWQHGVDWAVWQSTWDEIPVTHFRDTVWFQNPHVYTYQAPVEIIQLLQQMGAEYVVTDNEVCVGVPSMPDTLLLLHITFSMDDEDKAQELYDLFKIEFEINIEDARQDRWTGDLLLGFPLDFGIVRENYKNPNVELFEIKRSGLQFELRGLYFYDTFVTWLENFIKFLENTGCKDIAYTFTAEEVERDYSA